MGRTLARQNAAPFGPPCARLQFAVVTLLRSRLAATERAFCKGVCIDVDLAARRPLSNLMYGVELADLNHGIEGWSSARSARTVAHHAARSSCCA